VNARESPLDSRLDLHVERDLSDSTGFAEAAARGPAQPYELTREWVRIDPELGVAAEVGS